MTRTIGIAATLALFVSGACGGASSDPGVDALLQVNGAQFVAGQMPPVQMDGPKVKYMTATTNRVVPGLRNNALSGVADTMAVSVLLGLEGDLGYWIIPAGGPDVEQENARDFSASVTFSRAITPGKHAVFASAVDASGHIGVQTSFSYNVVTDQLPGALVISLTWDNDSDLDLHLVYPNPDPAKTSGATIEIWSKHKSAASPSDTSVPKNAAVLDFDSNGQCVIDGRRQEDITIAEGPPSGHYIVRVDTFSMCAQTTSRWKVTVASQGVVQAEAHGVASPTDGYPAQGGDSKFGQDERPGTAGAGQVALEFDL